MKPNTSFPSLLPYLEPADANIRLHIISASAETGESVPRRFPFRISSQSSPFARLLRAEILTDAGSVVQPVFLLVQNDVYFYQPNELQPLSNVDVENCWQQAQSFFYTAESGNAPIGSIDRDVIRLGEATTENESREPFHSLFFCSHRHVFFHPPCPGCGQVLFLCKDDPLLLAQGLSPYTTSLRRYLYCRSCPPATSGHGFYTAQPDMADAGGVRDGIGLIGAWRQLLAGGLAPVEFPCRNCPECDTCYGQETHAAARIVPFGFYPFYMMVFKAMTIRTADFLPLVSGEDFDHVERRLQEKNEPARISDLAEFRRMLGEKDLFLFDGTEKHFLEILYLKLSLLNDITTMVRTGPAPLDILAALDCLWVKIPAQGSFLPGLWSFRVGYMNIGLTHHAARSRVGAQQSQITYFLGFVWFHVLLTNASQPAVAVIAGLTDLLGKTLNTETDQFGAPLFALENIFWNPSAHRQKGFPSTWKNLWQQSLGLAWTLLTADKPADMRSWDKFQQDLSAIRKEIKKLLFVDGETPSMVSEQSADDTAIHKVLTSIIGKWENASNSVYAAASDPDDIQAETILLPPDKAQESHCETVMVTQDGFQEELEKTVLISSVKNRAGLVTTPMLAGENIPDDPCETMILSGKPAAPLTPTDTSPKAQHVGNVDEDDILSETVILRPPKQYGQG